MAKPHFIMHWHEEIPVAELPGAKVVVHAGTFNGKVGFASSQTFSISHHHRHACLWLRISDGVRMRSLVSRRLPNHGRMTPTTMLPFGSVSTSPARPFPETFAVSLQLLSVEQRSPP